jgi:cytoskeletal protein RodZ
MIVLTVMVIIGAAGWLGWLVIDDDSSSATDIATPSATSAAPDPSAAPTPSDPAESEATPEQTTPEEPDEPEPEQTSEAPSEVGRDAAVSVLNNSGVSGAARAFSAKVTGAGWTVEGVGNWRGSIPTNTVYYPAGLQEQAQLLAKDVDVERILPSVSPMRMDRLTIILSGPQ